MSSIYFLHVVGIIKTTKVSLCFFPSAGGGGGGGGGKESVTAYLPVRLLNTKPPVLFSPSILHENHRHHRQLHH